MSGSKYTLEVNVTGNADKKLGDIGDSLSKVVSQAGAIKDATEKASDSLDKMGEFAKAGFAQQVGGALKDMGEKLTETFHRGMEGAKDMFKDILKESATFEDIQSSLQFAFGNEWEQVFEDVKKDAANLTFTLEQVSELAASLGRMKINPFGGTTEESQKFKSKTGETVRALEVLQDTADAVGKSTDDLVVSLRNAFAGNWKSLEDRFDIPKDKIKEWKKESEKLKEPQEKYNYLIGKLGEMFGGAGALKAQNFNKIVAQLPDILQQIKAIMGSDGLKTMTPAFAELVNALNELKDNKEAMAALKMAFTAIATVVSYGVRLLAQFVRSLGSVLAMAPFLPLLAAALFLVVMAVLAVAGAMMTAAGAAVALSAMVAALTAEMMLPALLIIPIAVAGFLALAGAILVGYAAFQIFATNVSGVTTSMENMKLAIAGLNELISSYNGVSGTMSQKTADALKQVGLFDTVKQIFMVFHRAASAFEAFKMGMSDFGARVAPAFLPMMDELKLLFYELADAFGLTTAATDGSATSTKSWTDVAKDLVTALVQITKGIIDIVRVSVAIVRVANHFKLFHAAGIAIVAILGVMVVLGAALAASMFLVLAPVLLVLAAVVALGAAIAKAVLLLMALKNGGIEGAKKEWSKSMLPEFKGDLWGDRREEGDKNPFRKRPDMGGQKGRDKEGNWVGTVEGGGAGPSVYSPEEEEAIARGGTVRKPKQQIDAERAGGEDYEKTYRRTSEAGVRKDVTSGADTAGPAPGTGGSAAAPDTGHAQVAEAVSAQTGVLSGIQSALAAFQVTVQLDSEAIARAVNKGGAAAGGAA